jgi:phage tail tape-measure protein
MSDDRSTDRDLKRNEDPDEIAGAVGGAAGAGTGGAIGFVAGGPLGGVIGALAGALGGWWAGSEAQSAIADMDQSDNQFREAHEHAGARRSFEEVRHGYQLGYLAGRNPDHEDRAFVEVENDLRAAWTEAHVDIENAVAWDEVRDEARAGYELARRSAPD